MTDETQIETKRGPGRPREAPPHVRRQPVHKPVHSGRDAESDRIEKYEFIPFEARDKFYIPSDVVESFRRDYGRALMWVSLECMGRPMDDFVAARRRNGWEEMPSREAGGRAYSII